MSDRIRGLLSLIGPVIGLVSLGLALYFRFQSIQERVPTYYVHPARAKIVDATGPLPSELEIRHKGYPVGNKSVTAITVYFWNDGRLPIRKSDILKPLIFELPKSSEILEPRVLRQSRDEINFEIRPVEATSPNSLLISFDILEKSDGAAIQIIYTGDPNTALSLKGTIVGAPNITLHKATAYYEERPSPEVSYRNERRFGIIFMAVGVFFLLAAFSYWLSTRRNAERSRLSHIALIVSTSVAVLYIALGSYVIYRAYSTLIVGIPTSISASIPSPPTDLSIR